MLQSTLFTKTRRADPKDEAAKNARLLIRAGFIHKEMAGVYSFLPLGLKTLSKVISLIRASMDSLGSQEVFLSSLQDKQVWEKTDRWRDDQVDIWFKTRLKNDAATGLAFTHEEPLTALVANHLSSYQDLPVSIYQFQTKFRNETRAKSGLLRTREFIMKDLYSFSRDKVEHQKFYERVKVAYQDIFTRVGLGKQTYLTYASGGTFSKYSHEFQTVTDAGEDQIHVCEHCRLAINNEIISEQSTCPGCGARALTVAAAVEVGNIFTLGTKFSEPLGLFYTAVDGSRRPVFMGSYGIGPGRLLAAVAEVHSDSAGLIWPQSIAPFQCHLLALGQDSLLSARSLYQRLITAGIEVLFDDRDLSAGEKFSDADLLGLPYRLVVSAKTGDRVECKPRSSSTSELISFADLLSRLKSSS